MAFDFSSDNLDREFPVRKNFVYFNHAAVAPLPRRVAEAMTAHLENSRDRGAADWKQSYAGIERTREKAARLIGAHRSEVAFLPSTSWALNVVARSFPWKPGDNVVGDDMEFPANSLPWRLLEAEGMEYRVAKSREGRIEVDDLARLTDARTRVIAVSWVAFHNGFVFPIREIGEFCREKGILFVLDAIQGLGILPLDVQEAKVDVLAADAHKWPLGPEGATVFFVAEGARERVRAIFGGWWNLAGTGNYLGRKPELFLGARRYEPGSLPTAQVLGLSAGLDLLAEAGAETVRARVLETLETLREGLAKRNWTITTPPPLESGILAAVPPSGDDRAMAKELARRGIQVSPREGFVRFSPHFYNDSAEVERILGAMDEIG